MIAVVGPLTSLVVGAASLGLWYVLPDGLLRVAVQGLALANLVVGALNLVPGLPLDGGRVLRAVVWKVGGDPLRATVVAAWGGRVVALLAIGWPIFQQSVLHFPSTLGTFLMAGIIAAFLWSGASASLVQARLRRRMPTIQARLLARRVIVVPEFWWPGSRMSPPSSSSPATGPAAGDSEPLPSWAAGTTIPGPGADAVPRHSSSSGSSAYRWRRRPGVRPSDIQSPAPGRPGLVRGNRATKATARDHRHPVRERERHDRRRARASPDAPKASMGSVTGRRREAPRRPRPERRPATRWTPPGT